MKNSKYNKISFTMAKNGFESISMGITPNENITEQELDNDINELRAKVKSELTKK